MATTKNSRKPCAFRALVVLLAPAWLSAVPVFSQPQDAPETGGHLIIHGGGRLTPDVVERFGELGNAKDGHLVIIPTSGEGEISTDPKTAPRWLRSLGFKKISILHTRSREEADTDAFIQPLADATALWFSGGRQWRTMDVYLGTKSADAFHAVYRRGGVIGGSSAGATVQGSYLVRGAPEGNHIMMAPGHEAGFGFLPNTAIDQHAIRRKRLDDMIPVIARFPHLLGIAIDEGAALEVHQGEATVLGDSKVAFYDHKKWRGNAGTYELLAPGERYDLAARRAIPRKPNVVLFFTDDQGTLDANCYGSTDLYTPTMDALAAKGVRFTQAYAHTVCCPARAMLMTGRYPQRANVNMWTQGNAKGKEGRNMFREEVTLAEALQGAGYKTALFGKWHLGAHPDHGPTEQGFDTFYGLRGGFIDNYNHFFLHANGFHDLYEGKEEVFERGAYFPDLVTDRALQYIDRYKDQPFFLYMAFNIPHYPEQADEQFEERYKGLDMPRRSYAKMISTTDDRMGRIMDRLDRHGIAENTIVVFMSDNGHSAEHSSIRGKEHTSGLAEGTYYGAHGGGGNTGKWRGNKGSLWEGGIRVPAVISFPAKLPQGVVRDQAVTAMDWMPTILALCQVELPPVKLDGHSLLPVIASDTAASPYKELHWQWGNSWAVREGDWKLMGVGPKATFLGNVSDEAPEQKNYLREKPDVAKRLRNAHESWALEVQPRSEVE